MKKENTIRTFCSVVVAATVVGIAAPAFAQDTAPPPAASAPEVKRQARMAGDVGNGGLGVGATVFVSGLFGPEVVYDFGAWHLAGTLGFASTAPPNGGDRTTTFDFGIGGWYHLHIGENSDFSLGGAFALVNVSPPMGNSATGFEFEPGAQVRAFITPNVALHGGMGFVFEFGDYAGPFTKTIALASNANVTGDLGFTYYFR
jgi:hypothetical protein